MDEAEAIYDALVKSHILVKDGDDRFFDQFGLGKTRYFALVHLAEAPGMSLSELSERLLCTKGNTTRILKSLEQEGHLERQPDPADARGLRLFLTPQGAALLAEARAAFAAFHARRFANLGPSHAQALLASLDTINNRLVAQLGAAPQEKTP